MSLDISWQFNRWRDVLTLLYLCSEKQILFIKSFFREYQSAPCEVSILSRKAKLWIFCRDLRGFPREKTDDSTFCSALWNVYLFSFFFFIARSVHNLSWNTEIKHFFILIFEIISSYVFFAIYCYFFLISGLEEGDGSELHLKSRYVQHEIFKATNERARVLAACIEREIHSRCNSWLKNGNKKKFVCVWGCKIERG